MVKKNKELSGDKSRFPFLLFILITLTLASLSLAGYIWSEFQSVKGQMINKIDDMHEQPSETTQPIYAELDTFTITLKPSSKNTGNKVLHVGLTLKLANEKSKVNLEKFIPEVRSCLIILFSQQLPEQLTEDDAKHELIQKIKNAINTSPALKEKIIVTDVFFNAFILR